MAEQRTHHKGQAMRYRSGNLRVEHDRPQTCKFAFPLVFFPEFFTTANHAAMLRGYLVNLGWEVLTPDLRAAVLAESGPAGLARVRFAELVERARATLAELEAPGIVGLGHGVGGLLALELAARGEVKAAAALAPPPPGYRSRLFRRRSLSISGLLGRRATEPLAPPRGKWLARFFESTFSARGGTPKPPLVADSRMIAWEISHNEINWTLADRPQHGAAGSMLIVAGAHDAFAPPEMLRSFAEQIGAQLTVLPGTGHWLVESRTMEKAIAHVQRFFVKELGESLLLLYQGSPEDDEQS